MGAQADPFEASAATVGYLYQLRKALLLCVDNLEKGIDWSIAIEASDDIEVEHDSGAGWWQLKHRAVGTRLTDSSTDLWKSLRIWATAVSMRRVDLDRTDLFLLTTAEAPKGTVGYHLRPREGENIRDETEALSLLDSARSASTSKTNKAAYEAWDELSSEERSELLARVQVLDCGLNIEQTEARLHGRAALAVGHEHATAFLQRLDGWFVQRVVKQLRDSAGPITGLEFDGIFTERRDQFRPNNLPIDDDVLALSGDVADQTERMFVRQLALTGIGQMRIRLAVRDYLRAYTQRSRWSSENLLRPGEVGQYERRLIEEWETRFAIMEDELGTDAAEEDKRTQAKAIYAWVEQQARISIRPGCDEAFITKGSYHLLADDLEVGWHPDFTARLMSLLEPAVTR
ncbi:MAG: hypothetical protein EOP24_27325 [Hyphomicrobiales bacterium]|nr:MAG: hypothetical protein EOP24_27325 [Hyphomicrobiales bacterium]